MLKGEAYEGGDWNVANAHYVPSATKITIGGKEYTTGDMFETALRSYLLIRGYNGLDAVNYGKGKIAALEGGAVAMSATEVPETHGYYFGENPFNETPGNGGHLVLGTADVNEHCKVKTDILDNWAMRSLNFQKGQPITNLCGYSGGQLDGYYGGEHFLTVSKEEFARLQRIARIECVRQELLFGQLSRAFYESYLLCRADSTDSAAHRLMAQALYAAAKYRNRGITDVTGNYKTVEGEVQQAYHMLRRMDSRHPSGACL